MFKHQSNQIDRQLRLVELYNVYELPLWYTYQFGSNKPTNLLVHLTVLINFCQILSLSK